MACSSSSRLLGNSHEINIVMAGNDPTREEQGHTENWSCQESWPGLVAVISQYSLRIVLHERGDEKRGTAADRSQSWGKRAGSGKHDWTMRHAVPRRERSAPNQQQGIEVREEGSVTVFDDMNGQVGSVTY